MKIRTLLLGIGLFTTACGDDGEGPPDGTKDASVDGAAHDAALPTDAGDDEDAAGGSADSGNVLQRGLRVVSAAPQYALVGERYRYRPKTNTRTRSMEMRQAPDGMILKDGVVEWTPTPAQAGMVARGVLYARGDGSDESEQPINIAVATSTLRASEDVSSESGGSVYVMNVREGRLFGAGVDVSAGALRAGARITVSELDRAPSLPNVAGTMRAVQFGPSGQVFDAPARVTLPLASDVLASAARVTAYVYDPAGRWRRVPTASVDPARNLMMARASHFSIYAAVQSALDLTPSLSRMGATSACEGSLAGRALLRSPLSDVDLTSVNNLDDTLRAQVPGENPTVGDLLRVPGLRGSLRMVSVLDLVELHGDAEVPRDTRVLVTTLFAPGDGSATITHTDALGNPLATRRYAQPLLELADLEARLKGEALTAHFTAASDGTQLALAARVHVAYYVGDASLDPVNIDDLGLAAIEVAPAGIGQENVLDGDCDGVVEPFDATDDRLAARLSVDPSGVVTASLGEQVTLRALLLNGAGQIAWTLLDSPGAMLSELPDAPAARQFVSTAPGRHLVSARVSSGGRMLENVFAIDVLPPIAQNTPPRCQPITQTPTGRVGEAVALAAVASDAESESSLLRIEWGLLGSGQDPTLVPAGTLRTRGDAALFAPLDAGKYRVGCRAFDGQIYGPPGVVELSLLAATQNRPPVDLVVSPPVARINAGETITLRATARDPDGDALSFSWSVEGATVVGEPASKGAESTQVVRGDRGGVARIAVTASDGNSELSLHTVATLLIADAPIGNVDADGDGFPAGTGALADCNDNDPTVHPTAIDRCGDRVDSDCDGELRIDDCDYDDITVAQGDCDDNDPRRHPRAVELCDGLDNDCNGTADDQYGVGKRCVVGMGACQTYGIVECGADGESSLCSTDPLLPSEEVCDKVDNDCDGVVDEPPACGVPDAGTSTLPDGGVEAADASVCRPSDEVCDGLDNDCNGMIDDLPQSACDTGLQGICAVGAKRCVQQRLVCVATNTALPETCNKTDDDCDGKIDDDIDCSCDDSAREICTDKLDNDCDGLIDAADPDCCKPSKEICDDKIDNDCDGAIDFRDSECVITTAPTAT